MTEPSAGTKKTMMELCGAIDVGGTKIASALFTRAGEISAKEKTPIDKSGGDAAAVQVRDKIGALEGAARAAIELERYAEFIQSRPDYIVNQALLVTFGRDREFQTWLVHFHPEDATRIQELVKEQPRGGARRALETTESPARE